MFKYTNVLIKINHLVVPVRNKSYIDRCRPCPPCPCPKKPEPKTIVEKTCKKCSFWEQEQDNCRGKPWQLKQQGPFPKAKMVVCKSSPKVKCDKRMIRKASCADIIDCDQAPPCPKPTWERS